MLWFFSSGLYDMSLNPSEAATRDVLWKKVFLEISQNSQENTGARVSFLLKLQALGLRTPFLQNISERLFLILPVPISNKERRLTYISIFAFLCGASKGVLKAFIKSF